MLLKPLESRIMNGSDKLPVIFIPHGGGPWHIIPDAMGDPVGYGNLRGYLKELGNSYRSRIRSILMVSAHWEETFPTIHFGESPNLYYDYYGFPEYTYHLSWPAPGNPNLALRVEQLLNSKGFNTRREMIRGYDHGTFVPMMVAFPEAQLPVVQLSLVRGLDPSTHIAVGQALEPLRSEGVLIIGSGMSYHNMQGFMSGSPEVESTSKKFDNWLAAAVEVKNPEQRIQTLVKWAEAPGAFESHPRSEHLVPLFVVAGAAGSDAGKRSYNGKLMSATISGFTFG